MYKLTRPAGWRGCWYPSVLSGEVAIADGSEFSQALKTGMPILPPSLDLSALIQASRQHTLQSHVCQSHSSHPVVLYPPSRSEMCAWVGWDPFSFGVVVAQRRSSRLLGTVDLPVEASPSPMEEQGVPSSTSEVPSFRDAHPPHHVSFVEAGAAPAPVPAPPAPPASPHRTSARRPSSSRTSGLHQKSRAAAEPVSRPFYCFPLHFLQTTLTYPLFLAGTIPPLPLLPQSGMRNATKERISSARRTATSSRSAPTPVRDILQACLSSLLVHTLLSALLVSSIYTQCVCLGLYLPPFFVEVRHVSSFPCLAQFYSCVWFGCMSLWTVCVFVCFFFARVLLLFRCLHFGSERKKRRAGFHFTCYALRVSHSIAYVGWSGPCLFCVDQRVTVDEMGRRLKNLCLSGDVPDSWDAVHSRRTNSLSLVPSTTSNPVVEPDVANRVSFSARSSRPRAPEGRNPYQQHSSRPLSARSAPDAGSSLSQRQRKALANGSRGAGFPADNLVLLSSRLQLENRAALLLQQNKIPSSPSPSVPPFFNL